MDRKILIFMSIGFECVLLVGGFILLGRWLEEKYGWGNLGTAMGALLGVTAWIIHLIALFKQLNKPTDVKSDK